jgi:hypothetical protein
MLKAALALRTVKSRGSTRSTHYIPRQWIS